MKHSSLGLTPRQEQVVELVSQGLANKQIAYELQIVENTVKAHLADVFIVLGVRNRTELAVYWDQQKTSPGMVCE